MPPIDIDTPAAGDASLDRFWDAYVTGDRSEDDHAGLALAGTVRAIHELDDVPGPDPALVARMWANALSIAEHSTPLRPTVATPARSAIARWFARTEPLVALIYAGAVSGAIVGLAAIGIGLRLSMRISGALTASADRGQLTEAGNRVGEITLIGTFMLLLLGIFLGMAGGIAYLVVRPWLPWNGWKRGLVYGGLLFALGGSSLFEGGRNQDYRTFGIAGLNVCLFGAIPVLFGLAVAPLADLRLARALRQPSRKSDLRHGIEFGAAAVVFVGMMIAAHPAIAVAGLAIVRLLLGKVAGRFDTPRDLLRRPAAAIAGYAVFATPCLVGLILTAKAIERILV
jgi:hypothetical protein